MRECHQHPSPNGTLYIDARCSRSTAETRIHTLLVRVRVRVRVRLCLRVRARVRVWLPLSLMCRLGADVHVKMDCM